MARNARSLDVLTAEIHARSPRTTVYDIGDPDHQARESDHNPNRSGVVCAIDIMPGHGLDLGALAEEIRARRHPAGKYVIYQDRIASAARGWAWREHTGDYHDHVHVSAGVGPDGASTGPYDNTEPWLTEDDMTPQQAWVLHVMNYRLEAILANRPTVLIPARADLGTAYAKAVTEPNQLYTALNRPLTDVDEQALAAALGPLLETGATPEEVAAAVVAKFADKLAVG
ncbi:hypothetical protein Cme02nite_69460 [Catellatospora methionotrophica]|uniref:Uncharacterized protein n=2 Tax=Catellatospora methionotrophica TaxID=121620 RepID=A0A8J3LGV5_9ACTN|nr:hypothetical protein Cme02nite_69460 [Catellatospora methionotrophica]